MNSPIIESLRADLEGLQGENAALSILNEILAENTKTGNVRFDAELQRKRGLFLYRAVPDDPSLAEAALKKALAVARTLDARTYTLRASLNLARLYCDTGREREAVPLMQGALVGFTETPELPEIGEAQRLLVSLGGALPPVSAAAIQ